MFEALVDSRRVRQRFETKLGLVSMFLQSLSHTVLNDT